MKPFNYYTRLFDEAGDDGADGGGGAGDDKPVSNKIKLGTKEYDPDTLSSAASLYEALQDPETGSEIIETLARKAGLLDKKGDIVKKEGETNSQAKTRVSNALKRKLGKDYDVFSDKVGPALEEIFEEMLEERSTRSQSESSQSRWEDAVTDFTSNHETTADIENAMKELISEAPPNVKGKNFDAKKYLSRIYKNACEEVGETPREKGENRKSSRRRNDDDEFPDIVEKDRPKNASIDDAVEAAMRGIRYKKRN